MAARTGNGPVFLVRRVVLQQLRQSRSSRLMHGGTDNGFDRFQIERAFSAALLKNQTQKPVYFFGDLALDLFCRFFSRSVCSACPTGRKRQIFLLTSTTSPVNVLNLRNSAISLSALRTAARDGRLCVNVLPWIFPVI